MEFNNPHSLTQGVPQPLRGQIWQMLVGIEDDTELLNSYSTLAQKVGLLIS